MLLMLLTTQKDNQMAQLNPNSSFASFILTESELRMAQQLSPETEMYLQNLICETATDKVNIAINPQSFEIAMRDEAYARGMLAAYQHLLAVSRASKQADADNSDWSGVEHN